MTTKTVYIKNNIKNACGDKKVNNGYEQKTTTTTMTKNARMSNAIRAERKAKKVERKV